MDDLTETKAMSVRLTTEQAEWLRVQAFERRTTQIALIREALAAFIENEA